jgi:hypothetical protein
MFWEKVANNKRHLFLVYVWEKHCTLKYFGSFDDLKKHNVSKISFNLKRLKLLRIAVISNL